MNYNFNIFKVWKDQLSVCYFLFAEHAQTREGRRPSKCVLTINGIRADSAVKRYIEPESWSTIKGRAISKTKECKELNAYLDTIKLRLFQIQREMELDGLLVTPRALLNRYLGVDDRPKHTILGIFREHNEKCAKLSGIDMAPATVQRYETSYKHTVNFMKHCYGVSDMNIEDINHKFITDYEFYLKTERRCSHNSVVKYLKNFKKITNIALANEIIVRDPFVKIKFHYEEVSRDYLTDEELQTIINKELPIERLAQVRDVFVFCSLTGLSFSDVKQLRDEHIVKDNNGALWIRKRRQKTSVMCNVPLLTLSQEILDRYKGHPACIGGELLPVPSNQRFNEYLKEVADICGITKSISSHCARHTAATTTFFANGVSIENVAKMLGHSDTKMTRHYAKVLDKSIMRDMEEVNRKMIANAK